MFVSKKTHFSNQGQVFWIEWNYRYLEINHSWLCDIQKDFSCSKMFFQIFDKGYVQSFVLFYSISIIYSLICAHLSSLPRGNSSILLFWWYPIVSNIGKLLFHLSHIHHKVPFRVTHLALFQRGDCCVTMSVLMPEGGHIVDIFNSYSPGHIWL